MDLREKRIYIAGSSGMVGSALAARLNQNGYQHLVTRRSDELDLRRQSAVEEFFDTERPEMVVIAAAKVGGILANSTYRAEFIYDNISIVANLIEASRRHKVEKLIYLGSSCIYPRMCPQPMREEYLLTGPLEETNEPYAIAKIAGVKLCENYFRQYGCNFYSVMPTNLYGANDNFDLQTSHVIPALMRKFHQAKIGRSPSVSVWGSGDPKREFMFVNDLAEALEFLLTNIDIEQVRAGGTYHLNIGTGTDLTIRELAERVAKTVGFRGSIEFDSSKPDGTPRKLLDVTKIRELGWSYSTDLSDGLVETYRWFLDNVANSFSGNAKLGR